MKKHLGFLVSHLICVGLVLAFAAPAIAESALEAGVGRCVITPEQDTWMAGYAARTEPSDGKIHDLHAKALAVKDGTGAISVVITMDLIGIPAHVADRTASMMAERHGIPRERLLMVASHTHCGPALYSPLGSYHGLDDEQRRRVEAYTEALPGKLVSAAEAALSDVEPARLAWGLGEATFAMNRREYTPDGVTIGENPIGPVDHDVPVLVARRRSDDTVKSVLFGYGCHNTTLSFQQLCGDYAGFAQYFIEDRLPDAVALFATGCAGDVNPVPRRSLELAQGHGKALGSAVLRVIYGEMAPVEGPLKAAFEEIPLAMEAPPTRSELEDRLEDGNKYIQGHARRMLQIMDKEGALPEAYPYPVQIWRFADSLQITALGGEVVADYAFRIKHEFGRDKQFIMGYANDVMGYIPSLRVLQEGGYEGRTSVRYSNLHSPWAPSIEADIMAAIGRLSAEASGAGSE